MESLLDDDDIFLDPENDKRSIEEWIKANYKVTGNLIVLDDFVVDCTGSVGVKNRNIESLTNGLFRWGNVGWNFDCDYCKNLTSLKGVPKEVGGSFWCNRCGRLETLEGAPEKVGGIFDCSFCYNLKSLKGAPKEVGGKFDYSGCKNLRLTDQDREKYGI